MKGNAIIRGISVLAMLPSLAACSPSDKPTSSGTSAASAGTVEGPLSIGTEVRRDIAQAKQQLLTQDIDVSNVHIGDDSTHASSLPKAVITPQGALVIAGKSVDATPPQRAMLMDYRQQIIGIAAAGMDIGTSGADLGMHAAKEAIFGALTGKSDQDIDASIKPQVKQIQAAAMQLCKRLPDLLASQRKLAAAMPAFRPYATMTQKDIDDCDKDTTDGNGKKGFAVFSD